ncbi:helix-turn-helix transcriptional regulator [Oscillatoria sp. FACHB-1407]|uniref:helix-turn-helix domain-containing protein n=1 Tax=Oscillatoria sp. FACHB-1407 TaxID=2692847 RepID=UPI001681D2E5|nr:AraC family transcriptional regulator [Oscillatoria sp. FACHB-1407]MBD2463081.1 helix-turn-helix transcriptional regulator [Oscillatoria sp. FACHB-1407]
MQTTSSQLINVNIHDAVEMQQVLPCAPRVSSRSLDWSGVVLDYYNHPGHEVPEHYAQQHVIAVTLSEQVKLHQRIETDSECSILDRGDMVICPAGFQRWCAWEDPAEFLVLSIDQSTLAEALYQTGDTRQLELVPQLKLKDRVIEHLVFTMANEIKTAHPTEPFYINSLLHLLYFHLLRHHTTANVAEFPKPSHPSKRMLLKAIEYMQANLHSDPDLLAIAPLLNTTSYELTLLFLDLTGLTPYQYLMRCRIERAKQLLAHKKLSIKEVAAQIGFTTVHQFNAQFLRLTGISPNIYRSEYAL